MPLIRVSQPEGADREARAAVVRELTEAYVRATGSAPKSVWVILDEISRDDWGIEGSTLTARAAASA